MLVRRWPRWRNGWSPVAAAERDEQLARPGITQGEAHLDSRRRVTRLSQSGANALGGGLTFAAGAGASEQGLHLAQLLTDLGFVVNGGVKRGHSSVL